MLILVQSTPVLFFSLLLGMVPELLYMWTLTRKQRDYPSIWTNIIKAHLLLQLLFIAFLLGLYWFMVYKQLTV